MRGSGLGVGGIPMRTRYRKAGLATLVKLRREIDGLVFRDMVAASYVCKAGTEIRNAIDWLRKVKKL